MSTTAALELEAEIWSTYCGMRKKETWTKYVNEHMPIAYCCGMEGNLDLECAQTNLWSKIGHV